MAIPFCISSSLSSSFKNVFLPALVFFAYTQTLCVQGENTQWRKLAFVFFSNTQTMCVQGENAHWRKPELVFSPHSRMYFHQHFSSYTHRECAVDFTDNDNDWTWGKVKVHLSKGPICVFWPWYRCLREGRCPLQMEKYFVLRLAGSVFTPSNNWELTRNENTRSFCV